MTRTQTPRNMVSHSRRSYVSALLVLAIGVGALVAVLALPAIERFIWADSEQESER